MADNNTSILRSSLSQSQQALLERKLRGNLAAKSQKQVITRRSREEDILASFPQQRLWLIDQLDPGNPVYNVVVALEMKGQLDIDALEQSINQIIIRHEVLRTTLENKTGALVQKINPAEPIEIKVIDLLDTPEEDRKQAAEDLTIKEAETPFDLNKSPLIRSVLIKVDIDEYIFQITMHHIASDEWSMGILFKELSALYAAFSRGESPTLEELPVQYADFAAWQRELLSGPVLEQQLSYWKKQLENLPPVLELPLDYPRPSVQTFRGAIVSKVMPQELNDDLKKLTQQEHVTLFMVLLAALQVLFYRYSRQEDIAIGVPIANRNQLNVEKLIGFFVNTLVLRTNLSGQPTFMEVLGRVRDTTLEAYTHQDIPFEKIVEELQPERNTSYSPFFQVMFALQNTPGKSMEMPNLTTKPKGVKNKTAKFDLTLVVDDRTKELSVSWNYNTDLFKKSTVERISGHFETLLKAIASNPYQKISHIPILTPKEQNQMLSEWNNSKRERPNKSVYELFEDQVKQRPDYTALVFEGRQLTYKELNARANQLARYLRSLGVGPEVIVEICVERSFEMVIGLIGILKAGGAYMPLDPMYPKDRLDVIVEGVASPVVLTQQRLLDKLPSGVGRVVCLDSDWEVIAQQDDSDLGVKTDFDNIMGIIQTSGSTGRPKGTMITGGGFQNLCLWYRDSFNITEKTSYLLMTSFSYDTSFRNIMTPLISGGRVILANPGYYDASELFNAIVENKVTFIMTTPSQIYPILELAEADQFKSLSTMECLVIGGEVSLWPKLRPWQNSGNCNCHFVHMYGPAECSDVIATYNVSEEELNTLDNMPVGPPIHNAQAYVLDEDYNLLPIRMHGQICAGGRGVSRGYLNRPDLTAASFVPNPFEPGRRMYKTGDLGRWLETGVLDFVGRVDHQVKIRGQRLELDEVLVVINQYPGVRQNIVVAKEYTPGDKRVVAYVAADEADFDVEGLRQYLKSKLASYMVPSYIMVMETLPLTTNGKVNRHALPDPDWSKTSSGNTYVAPRNQVEEVLAEVWAEILSVEKVGIYDDFFQLGGHSLLATRLITRVCREFAIKIPLRSIFEQKTIADQAILVEATIIREITEAGAQSVS